jgi:ABC-type multidrug transport system ATPase subunit
VSRSYGPLQALKPIDLTLAGGQCIAFLGVNGSGKSTLLRIAAGRDTPTTGQVTYDGRVLREDALIARREIAVVGDARSAYPDLTVREHVLMVAVAHGAVGTHPNSSMRRWPNADCPTTRWPCRAGCPAASSKRSSWRRSWCDRAGC